MSESTSIEGAQDPHQPAPGAALRLGSCGGAGTSGDEPTLRVRDLYGGRTPDAA
jgi:hypothetical protein